MTRAFVVLCGVALCLALAWLAFRAPDTGVQIAPGSPRLDVTATPNGGGVG